MTALLILAAALVTPQMSRAEFCRRLGEIEEGMPQAKVEALLGKPDDIWTAKDPEEYSGSGEVWCYGTNGHLTLPTLGWIWIKDGKAANEPWSGETPRAAVLFEEGELRKHLRYMYRPPDIRPISDGSLRLLRVANYLIPLGKEKALALIEEASRVRTAGHFFENFLLYYLPLVIFDLRQGGTFRPPGLGTPTPAAPLDPNRFPRFPVAIYKDIPYVLVDWYELYGKAESLESYLKEFKDCTMRKTLLRPPDNPYEAARTALQDWKWYFEDVGVWKRSRLHDAASLMLTKTALLSRTVCRTDEMNGGRVSLDASRESELEKAFLAAGGHWDEKQQMYVRKDGTSVPDTLTRDSR
jgi:hypothetical protein